MPTTRQSKEVYVVTVTLLAPLPSLLKDASLWPEERYLIAIRTRPSQRKEKKRKEKN